MICSAWKMHPGAGWFKGEGGCVGGWYLDGLCIQMWENHSSCSPDCFHSDSNQPLPKGLSQKIVPLVFQNKTCINGFFHGKPLALQMIQTVSVSSLLCFSALSPPPTFPRQDSWTQSACLSEFLGSIHVNNFSLVILSPVFFFFKTWKESHWIVLWLPRSHVTESFFSFLVERRGSFSSCISKPCFSWSEMVRQNRSLFLSSKEQTWIRLFTCSALAFFWKCSWNKAPRRHKAEKLCCTFLVKLCP